MIEVNEKAKQLKQSSIRAASVRCAQTGGINLGQGVCDLPVPESVQEAVAKALKDNHSKYSACEGIRPLREKLAQKLAEFNFIQVDPSKEIMISHGSTGAFVSAVQTLFKPGDEVILFEPFYGYHRHILELHGVGINTVEIDLYDFEISFVELEKAVTERTRAIVVCTPCNPCGKVFSREELLKIGHIAKKNNLVVITDEIYEYITYPGEEHVSIASLEDFKEFTLTISGFSKTYNMTGWRLGYVTGPANIISKMALVQDLLYVCPATPLQYAVMAALDLPASYYQQMRDDYLVKRDLMLTCLRNLGFQVPTPQGAYYLMANFEKLGFADDEVAVDKIFDQCNIAVVQGRAFYNAPERGRYWLRFCYALGLDVIEKSIEQLQSLKT